MTRVLYLGSEETPAWAGRARTIDWGDPVRGRGRWATIDPAGPDGQQQVIVAPRYAGDALDPPSEIPLTVDLWMTDDADQLVRVGIGELYDDADAAAATRGGR